MNSRILLAAGGACLLLIAGGLYLHGQKGAAPLAPRELAAPAKAEAERDPLSTLSPTPEGPAATTVRAEEKLSDGQRREILGKIEEASVTYDPKGLPLIEPYLLHPDPEVRTAAINGMIVLGEAGAAPLLREAASKATSPKEAVALTEAAEYLELPAGTFIPAERTTAGTRLPNAGEAGERSRPRLGVSREQVKDPAASR